MSGCATAHLTLPLWDGGSRKIRFIYLVNVTSFSLTECPNKDLVVPLYLGADLFSNTVIRTENHPRYHAKYARKGLATKIHFSSAFRFHGLKVPIASNSLWFYSIQGLFRVAFEMYNKQEQLAVLENLQDVWKSQINDSPLEMSYNLSEQLDNIVSTKSVCSTSQKFMSPSQSCQDNMGFEDLCGSDTADTSADHDYCSFPKQRLQPGHQTLLSAVRKKLQCLDFRLSSESQRYIEKLETIWLFLEPIDQYMCGTLEEKHVTETLLALLNSKDWGGVYSSSLLNCLGRWLGQQFHTANSSISQRVEDFKVQHIERISDLPPAEKLVTELFPEAMQTLLLHWMGLSEECTLEKRHSEYPILLLILEFVNHNLITGVAHVLYSSLLCKDGLPT
ncbi:uncharacterized protein si:ch211-110p13.9 [Thalassophryne amazonica]|uniref:uncharacterized protein si:ch211-110p13.9 n=1 Tax=Thalassophryne amazonica TaxID=390379 RepID=UPI00147162D3|nr:uncharacterized protein si:ch211-110p13.9 [Thalassophryne amazonica]